MDTKLIAKADEQADLCRIFGNNRRLLIIWLLGEGEMSVSEIAENIQATIQNTSQHLRVLKDRGVISSRRDGHTVYYALADNRLSKICLRMFRPFDEAVDQNNRSK